MPEPDLPVSIIDGIYYTWIPLIGNPSVIVMHRWAPEHDTWVQTDNITCVPSSEWGTNTKPN